MPATDLSEILERVASICTEITGPQAAEVDRNARWPVESLRALQQAGLGGLIVPEASGGQGHGLLALVQVCELLGRQCASTALCFGMHCVGAAVIAAKASPKQSKAYLEPIVRGAHLTTLALSEPGSGVHFYYPQTKLMPEAGGGFRVAGEKAFVTNGSHADSYVISTRAAEPGAAPGLFSCAVVPNDVQGLSWGAPWRGIGLRGNASREMKLRQVPLEPTALLGKEGDQLWYVFHVVTPYFLAAMTGSYLGVADAAVGEARSCLAKRSYTHSGSSPGHHPVVQHRLGTLWAKVERTRQLAYHAARSEDQGHPNALELLASAKAEVAESAVTALNEALSLCGGSAYREGGRLERGLRDVQAVHVMSPTTDLLRIWTGRALLGLPILAE